MSNPRYPDPYGSPEGSGSPDPGRPDQGPAGPSGTYGQPGTYGEPGTYGQPGTGGAYGVEPTPTAEPFAQLPPQPGRLPYQGQSPYGSPPPAAGQSPYGSPPPSAGPPPWAPAYGGPMPGPVGYGGPGPYGPGPLIGDVGEPRATRATSEGFRLFGRGAGPLIAFLLCGVLASLVASVGLGIVLTDAGMPTRIGGSYAPWNYSMTSFLVSAFLTGAVEGFIGAVASLMFLRGALNLARHGVVRFADMVRLPPGWWAYGLAFGAIGALNGTVGALDGAWASLAVAVSLLCLVATIALVYAPFLLIDEVGPPAVALTGSARLVGENIGQCLLFLLIAVALSLAGLLACVVGLLVSTPIISIGLARLYLAIRREAVVLV